MSHNAPLSSEERLEIAEVLRKGNLSHREIARQFKRSQSTVSKIARDSGITPTHRRRRSPAAKDLEGSFTREERVRLTDRVLGVIGALVEGGGLNPRELRETTQALKSTLDARRAEDTEPEGHKEEGKEGIVWDDAFASEESKGMGYDPNTKIGREMIQFIQKLDEGRDPSP